MTTTAIMALRLFLFSRRFASTSTSRSADSSDLELARARRWLRSLNLQSVPRHLGHISFSRSSGPGGQNVNKCISDCPPMTRVHHNLACARLIWWRQGQFQGHLEGSLGFAVAPGAPVATLPPAGLAICIRQEPDLGDPVGRVAEAIKQCGCVL